MAKQGLRYIAEEGQWLPGVPARNMLSAEVAERSADAGAPLDAAALVASGLYEYADDAALRGEADGTEKLPQDAPGDNAASAE